MALNAHHLAGWHRPHTHVPDLAAHLHDWLSRLMEKVKQEDACVASPSVAADEQVLLSVCDTRGLAVVASDRALYHQNNVFPRDLDDRGWARLPWELVGRVMWRPERQTVTLTGLVPAIAPTVLAMRDGAETALLARERVESTSLIQTKVDLGEYGTLRVLARQAPGTEHLVWVVALDDGIDVHAPAVEAAVHASLARLRADVGQAPRRANPTLGLRRGHGAKAVSGSAGATAGGAVTAAGRGNTYTAVAG